MVDYNTLIDAETWAFIAETERWYPADAVERSIGEQRKVYDALCRAFFAGYPKGITASDHAAQGVPLRHYQRASAGDGPVVLYIHGGGFILGSLESHDDICAEICDATGFDVVSPDYRLCPEHRHPVAVQDCLTALDWCHKVLGQPVVLAGDSAGGTLAAALAHARRGDSALLGQVLIYPGLGGDPDRGSYLRHAEAPMLTRADILFYESVRCDGAPPLDDASYAPLSDPSFVDLPPTVTIAAQCDPLCDDGGQYCQRITEAGGTAIAVEEPGLVHGYLRARHSVTRARRSFGRILRAMTLIGTGQPLTGDALNR